MKEKIWSALADIESSTGLTRYLPNRRNAILMYHSVGDPDGYGNVTVERFRSDIQYLICRYDIIDLPEVLSDTQKSKQVALTFDDGLTDFFENVLPILHEYNVPATVFVVAGELAGNNTNLNASNVMSQEQVDKLVEDDLVTVGNHTWSHPKLSELKDYENIEREIIMAKKSLEEQLSTNIDRFCYPSGDVSEEAREVVASSHDIAVTTCPGLVTPRSDPYLLRRISAHYPVERVRWELTDTCEMLRRTSGFEFESSQ